MGIDGFGEGTADDTTNQNGMRQMLRLYGVGGSKKLVFMARILPAENLLLQNVGLIINYLQ